MLKFENMKKKLDNVRHIDLNISTGVFTPTATTSNLIKAVKSRIEQPGSLLDLGSGSGVVGISLFLEGLIDNPLYASDISKESVACIKNNCTSYNIPVVVKEGSLFEPWRGMKFDYIVDDISGISEDVAKLSPWFEGVPCSSGSDGTYLTFQVLDSAKSYLNNGGMLFFPIISLSNVDSILEKSRKRFKVVEFLCREEWPLPKDMYQHLEILKKLQQKGCIQYREAFGIIICFTDVYVALS